MAKRLQDEIHFRRPRKPKVLPVVGVGKRRSWYGTYRTGNQFSLRSRFGPSSPFFRQRVTVKVHRTNLRTGKGSVSLARHRRYIERDGVGIDGKKPELFSAEGKQPSFEYMPGEPRYFRIILAPENGEKLDMPGYARRFMAEVEKSLGRELVWTAAVHYNTEHPHAHIVIRGLDAQGDLTRPVYLPPEFIKHGMREIAERQATLELGYRSEREVREQLSRELTQERFTSIDRTIARRADPVEHTVEPANDRERRRLEYLVEFDLARRLAEKTYQLSPTWEQDLRARSAKEDILKNIYAETKRRVDRELFYFYGKEQTVEGTVITKGVDNELKDTRYALIEAAERKMWYYAGRGVERMNVGERVRIEQGKISVLEHAKEVKPEREVRGPELGP